MARSDQSDVAELTLSKVSYSLIVVGHTFVPDSLRGKGFVGARAVRVIEDARAAGRRVVPLCPCLRAYSMKLREDPSDVIQW